MRQEKKRSVNLITRIEFALLCEGNEGASKTRRTFSLLFRLSEYVISFASFMTIERESSISANSAKTRAMVCWRDSPTIAVRFREWAESVDKAMERVLKLTQLLARRPTPVPRPMPKTHSTDEEQLTITMPWWGGKGWTSQRLDTLPVGVVLSRFPPVVSRLPLRRVPTGKWSQRSSNVQVTLQLPDGVATQGSTVSIECNSAAMPSVHFIVSVATAEGVVSRYTLAPTISSNQQRRILAVRSAAVLAELGQVSIRLQEEGGDGEEWNEVLVSTEGEPAQFRLGTDWSIWEPETDPEPPQESVTSPETLPSGFWPWEEANRDDDDCRPKPDPFPANIPWQPSSTPRTIPTRKVEVIHVVDPPFIPVPVLPFYAPTELATAVLVPFPPDTTDPSAAELGPCVRWSQTATEVRVEVVLPKQSPNVFVDASDTLRIEGQGPDDSPLSYELHLFDAALDFKYNVLDGQRIVITLRKCTHGEWNRLWSAGCPPRKPHRVYIDWSRWTDLSELVLDRSWTGAMDQESSFLSMPIPRGAEYLTKYAIRESLSGHPPRESVRWDATVFPIYTLVAEVHTIL